MSVWLCAWAMGTGSGLPAAVAQEPASDGSGTAAPRLVRMFTDQSEQFPISVRSPDSLENAALLALAEETYRTFLETMGIESLSGFALRVSWSSVPLEPPYDPLASFPRKVEMRPDGGRVFSVMTRGRFADNPSPADESVLREQFYRACMACYLQALVWSENVVVRDGSLVEPPFWLREGLTQLMIKARHETYGKIVENYRQRQRPPALQEVQEWDGFTDDALQSLWRQAFAYWLVKNGAAERAAKQALVLWLSSGNYSRDRSFLDPTPENESWWRNRLVAPTPALRNYDWDQTVAELDRCLQLELTLKTPSPDSPWRDAKLEAGKLPPLSAVKSAGPVRERVGELTDLQTKAHPAWMPSVELYRSALSKWLTGDQASYQALLAAAEKQRTQTVGYMSLVDDYVDWVMVNIPVNLPGGGIPSNARIIREWLNEESGPKSPGGGGPEPSHQ